MPDTLAIAVVGAGPAGLATALLLRRACHTVRVFERFEAARPVGSGLMLQPTGLAVLEALGLRDAVLARGQRIDRLFGRAVPSGRTVLNVGYDVLSGEAFGLGILRHDLFAVLHDAVQVAGIEIVGGHAVAGTRGESQGRRLTFENGRDAGPFDLIVDRLGARSPLVPPVAPNLDCGALWTTVRLPEGATHFRLHALEQRYRRARQMVGILPTGNGHATFFWSLPRDAFDSWAADGMDAWKAEVIALWPELALVLDQFERPEALSKALYLHRTLRSPVEERLAHVGDSAHSTSPQLGQGANMALLDAFALADSLSQCADVNEALQPYACLRRWHVRLYQAMSLFLTPVYQPDSRIVPPLRDVVLPLASRMPLLPSCLAAIVAGYVGHPMKALGLPTTERDAARAHTQP